MTFRTFCLMNDRRGQMKIKVCDSCFSISNIKYIDNQLVTVIKIQMICKCKYKTI